MAQGTITVLPGGLHPHTVTSLRAHIAQRLHSAPHSSQTSPPILIPVAPGDDPVDHLLTATYPPDTAVVVRTSGSTGDGKAVALTATNLLSSAHATHQVLSGPGVWILALPAHHVAGIQVLVRSIVSATPLIIASDEHGKASTQAIITAIDQAVAAATRTPGSPLPIYISLVPTQLHRLLNTAHPHHSSAVAALATVDAILLGGAPASEALLNQARNANITVVTTYGMSETSGGCVYNGVPLPGVTVHIDHHPTTTSYSTPPPIQASETAKAPHNTPPPGQSSTNVIEGRISLTGPMVAPGYVNASDREQENFSGTPDHRTIRTADIGRWDGHTLTVLGRIDDVIITGGIKIQPQRIEAVLDAHPRVQASCVVGLTHPEWGQELVAVIQVAPASKASTHHNAGPMSSIEARQHPAPHDEDQTLIDTLTGYCQERLPAPARPKRMMLTDQLPMRSIGKIDRRDVQRWVSTHAASITAHAEIKPPACESGERANVHTHQCVHPPISSTEH